MQAAVPRHGRFYTLGRFTVPTGVTRIRQISVTIEPCRGPFLGPLDSRGRRYCSRDRRYHLVAAKSRESSS